MSIDYEGNNLPIAYRVLHETRYSYQFPVSLSQQYLHLTPRNFAYQHCEQQQIQIEPLAEHEQYGVDYFGNLTRHITLTEPHHELCVIADFRVVVSPRPDLEQLDDSQPWEDLAQSMLLTPTPASLEALPFLYDSPHILCDSALADYARQSYTPGRPHLDAALALTQQIFDEFEFDPCATDIATPLSEVLAGRRGVCQDFAQLMIGCVRSLGLPARYVSGYLCSEDSAHLASHAWAEVWLDGVWYSFDVTNGLSRPERHLKLAVGMDYLDACPVRGMRRGGGSEQMHAQVQVSELNLQMQAQ